MNATKRFARHARRATIPLSFAFLSVFACSPEPQLPAGPPPNILFVIADDWSWPHAGAYGDSIVSTPTFDRIGKEGVLFTHAFSPAPSCTPARASILTGQYPHRLGEGANHMTVFPHAWDVYPGLLEARGYNVGFSGKGCNPGLLQGWKHDDPAGWKYTNFVDFLNKQGTDKPFCFWLGIAEPHRPYTTTGSWETGRRPEAVTVPDFLPDTRIVREDLLTYRAVVGKVDRQLDDVLAVLDRFGLTYNTMVVITSDNGMPFPRAKANCYDAGTRVPLAIRWPGRIPRGRTIDGFVHLSDLAPTFLELAGVTPPEEMTGRSLRALLLEGESSEASLWQRLLSVFRGSGKGHREWVFVERERHALGRGRSERDRKGFRSYPIRGIRTKEYLYLINFRPELWPACDPPDFRDVDDSPSKTEILKLRYEEDPARRRTFDLAFGRRPAEELYELATDPYQVHNLSDDKRFRRIKKRLRRRVERWMKDTGDPRAKGNVDRWDYYPYYETGPEVRRRTGKSGQLVLPPPLD